jgi:sodium transport system permease protein
MSLGNVKLILLREIRDQLRDRRTLFVVLVLPMLLYPLLGMSFIQVQQFLKEKPSRVLVIGARNLAEEPPLIEGRRFAPDLFSQPEHADLLELEFARDEPSGDKPAPDAYELGWRAVEEGRYDAALVIRSDFGEQIESFRTALRDRTTVAASNGDAPGIDILRIERKEKSAVAGRRIESILARWQEKVIRRNLEAAGVPAVAVQPFKLDFAKPVDPTVYQGAGVWSRVLPLLLVIWSLTGAFYPAVDLCAGEKERGTLETLLSSPAERSEIVLGKLLTVMLFSMVTAVLNLVSIGATGWVVSPYLQGLTPPPPVAAAWLAAGLLPMSALFGALCLAMAALARSSKEGQYYLVPLLLITLPLTVLPMSPSVELNLGNALVPVTGAVLLLRTLLEGNYAIAAELAPVVLGVTLLACYLAIRWAVDQFNSESVLFREGERFGLGVWLKHLRRDREPTPTVGAAVTCAVLILVALFFVRSSARQPESFVEFALASVTMQVALVAAPALILAWFLTRSMRRTLLIKGPTSWWALPNVLLLAVAIHPVFEALRTAVTRLYPVIQHDKLQRLGNILSEASAWELLLVMALTPAICEELFFRGFVLSGLRHVGHKWRAIVYTAVFFGLAHVVVQQQLITVLIGVVIGFVAVQTGSLLPCILLHLAHNALLMLRLAHWQAISGFLDDGMARWPWLAKLVARDAEAGYVFRWPVLLLSGLVALYVLLWFAKLKYEKTPEEQLQEAIDRTAREDEQELLGA